MCIRDRYRHLLVIKGGDKRIDCTPPHDVPLKPFRPLLVKPMPGTENITVPEGGAELTPQQTADLINDLIPVSYTHLIVCVPY